MGLAGLSAGPVVLMRPGTEIALVVGPLTHVKLATSVMARAGNTTWELGVSSETLSVPKAFVHRTLLTAAPGPTRAMLRWGKLARREAGLEKRVRDVATTKLGYFTDNGAMLSVQTSARACAQRAYACAQLRSHHLEGHFRPSTY